LFKARSWGDKKHERFSDAVKGTYNMQAQVNLDHTFLKAGLKSARHRSGERLLEIKIQCQGLQSSCGLSCQLFIYNLCKKKWVVEWEADEIAKEEGKEEKRFSRILRIVMPDGGNTHAIVVIHQKIRRSSAELGRAIVNLDQVLEACESPHMHMPAYVCSLSPAPEPHMSNEAWCQQQMSSEELPAADELRGLNPPPPGCCSRSSEYLEGGSGVLGGEGVWHSSNMQVRAQLVLLAEELPDASLLSTHLRFTHTGAAGRSCASGIWWQHPCRHEEVEHFLEKYCEYSAGPKRAATYVPIAQVLTLRALLVQKYKY